MVKCNSEIVKKYFDEAEAIYAKYLLPENLIEIFKKAILSCIKEKLSRMQKIRILDVGCGNGRWMKYILENVDNEVAIEIDGIDISDKLISLGKKKLSRYENVHFYTTNFLYYSVKDYDLIYFFDVIQHFLTREYLLIMKKLKTMLNPNGQIIFADKEKYSIYNIKMILKKRFKLVPNYYMSANYPSFKYLNKLAMTEGFKRKQKYKINNFHIAIYQLLC